MTKNIYGRIYAQERNREPFVIEVEIIEDNWDFQKSCYQQYELNAWKKKVNGEKNLILSKSNNITLNPDDVKDFIKRIKETAVKKHYKMITEREYRLIYKAYYID